MKVNHITSYLIKSKTFWLLNTVDYINGSEDNGYLLYHNDTIYDGSQHDKQIRILHSLCLPIYFFYFSVWSCASEVEWPYWGLTEPVRSGIFYSLKCCTIHSPPFTLSECDPLYLLPLSHNCSASHDCEYASIIDTSTHVIHIRSRILILIHVIYVTNYIIHCEVCSRWWFSIP